ncbi:MAG: methionyl-tRNA formyltransferase [Candidatus Roizmanbacteria bacterium]
MKRLNVAYFGSPDFSACLLEKLITASSMNRYIKIKLVVTQPDRPIGRKQVLTSTPVKIIAKKYNIKLLEIGNFLGQLDQLEIRSLDLVLVYAFSAIVPKDLLDLPKYGYWCIHPSLLPKYRGTSPMATALISGDKITGVTIIKMDEKIDHGPIITQKKYQILLTDKRSDLEIKLTDLAFEMVKKLVKTGIEEKGKIFLNPRQDPFLTKEQDHTKASYTKKLTKQAGFIEFKKLIPTKSGENSPEKLFNLFRGLYPWPGIWTILPNGKRLKITDMKLVRNGRDRSLQIKCVQLEGKKEVDFKTFKKAYKIF